MTPPARRRRRAVGPPGARPEQEGAPDRALVEEPADRAGDRDGGRPDPHADEELRRDRPPHHDQGV